MRSRLIVATNNAGKMRELRRILEPLGFSLVTAREAGVEDAADEIGETFEENAIAKARFVAERTGEPAIADDSGIAIDALGGAPGVRSARFAGPDATDDNNNRRLLESLRDVPDGERGARYVCVAACVAPDGRLLTARGEAEGVITRAPRGRGGFGYDPYVLDEASAKTFAEMTAGEKDAISHRGRAFRALARSLPAFLERHGDDRSRDR
ncbi:RdgB/HAM1 family non-canonical purine NTP pyrophosphatase [bacterium]|nr:RdgB/HAM1 family non-canonical purine NTP pyrophosphatase [bacterium]